MHDCSSCVRVLLVTGFFVTTSLTEARAATAPSLPHSSPSGSQQLVEHYADLPLSFEANQGQAGPNASFLARGNGYQIGLTGDAALLELCHASPGAAERSPVQSPSGSRRTTACNAIRMRLLRAGNRANPNGEEQLPGSVNYFIGNDPARWRIGIPTYAKVRYRSIYPGIDLIYFGNHRELEYDFVVAPGADPNLIQLKIDGAIHLLRATNGDLLVDTPGGRLTLRNPAIYQLVDGRPMPVDGHFALTARHTVRFSIGRYDHNKPLIIDPVLVYSMFVGGSGFNTASAIAVDANGEAFIAGATGSTNFPVTTGTFQQRDNGGTQTTNGFITKLNAAGTALVYSTYLGGSGTSYGEGDGIAAIAVDSAGDAYVTGTAGSTDFPTTPGAFQASNKAAANQCVTAFVTELNPTGTALVYSSYLGGSGSTVYVPISGDEGYAIAVDSRGNAYLTGRTYSTDFPVTQGAFQAVNNGAATKQANAFITKMYATGTALVYSTYLGGSGTYYNSLDFGAAIAVDSDGNAYIAGQAASTNFPVTSGAFQTTNRNVPVNGYGGNNAFITKLNPTGTALVYSTYLGGNIGDAASSIAINPSGNAYVTGSTSSTNFPVTPDAFQTTNLHGFGGPGGPNSSVGNNAFITKLNPSGSALVFSTYLGGNGGTVNFSPTLMAAGGDNATGIVIDSSGDAYVTGNTASSNFPVTPGAFQTINNDQTNESIGGYNAFVTEINPTGTALVYSTFLGGNGLNPGDFNGPTVFGSGDQAYALALDSANDVYVAGNASSADFPVTGGAFQTTMQSGQSPFVTKFQLSSGSPTTVTPTVTITQTPTPATSAQPFTLAVMVSGPSGSPSPTGTVTISATGFGPAQSTLSDGSSSFGVPGGTMPGYSCYPTLPANFVVANYLPDSASSSQYNFASATGGIYIGGPCFTITPNDPTFTWAQSQSQSTSFSIAGTAYTGLPLPTANVTLSTGSWVSAPAALQNSSASFTVPAGTFTSGFNVLNLSYSGDSNYVAMPQAAAALVTVGSVSVTVTPASTTIAQNVALPVAVTVSAGSGNPQATGMVTLLSTEYSSATTALVNGSATITIPAGTLPVGVNPLNVSYGSGNYGGASGYSSVTVTSASGSAGFTIGGSSVTVQPGATSGNTSTITVTPTGGFTGNVSPSAAITSSPSGAINLPTFGFGATSPVSITGTNAGMATMTISTIAEGGCVTATRAAPRLLFSVPGGAALAALILIAVPRRRRWRAWFALLLLVISLAGGVTACGKNGTVAHCDAITAPTTAGTYTITVTGTSGSTTASGTVTLTVQ
jgi:hypothetical protein